MRSMEGLAVVTYSTESAVRSPGRLVSGMIHDLVACRELAWRLAVRDVSAQYRLSMLGLFWAFVPPLAAGLLFIILQQKNVLNIADPGMPYALFALIGTTLWQVFADAVAAPLRVVTASRPLLARINFPREALILSAFYQTLFGFAVKAVLVVAVLVYFRVPFRLESVLAVLTGCLLIWLGLVIGLALTPAAMLVADVAQAITIALQLGFFLTPVIYPAPHSFPYSVLSAWNPVSVYLLATRNLLVHAETGHALSLAIVTAGLLCATLVVWAVYRVSMPIIIERISA